MTLWSSKLGPEPCLTKFSSVKSTTLVDVVLFRLTEGSGQTQLHLESWWTGSPKIWVTKSNRAVRMKGWFAIFAWFLSERCFTLVILTFCCYWQLLLFFFSSLQLRNFIWKNAQPRKYPFYLAYFWHLFRPKFNIFLDILIYWLDLRTFISLILKTKNYNLSSKS